MLQPSPEQRLREHDWRLDFELERARLARLQEEEHFPGPGAAEGGGTANAAAALAGGQLPDVGELIDTTLIHPIWSWVLVDFGILTLPLLIWPYAYCVYFEVRLPTFLSKIAGFFGLDLPADIVPKFHSPMIEMGAAVLSIFAYLAAVLTILDLIGLFLDIVVNCDYLPFFTKAACLAFHPSP